MEYCDYSRRSYLNGEMTSHLCISSRVVLELNNEYCDSCMLNTTKEKNITEGMDEYIQKLLT